jgi:hypothetical protein
MRGYVLAVAIVALLPLRAAAEDAAKTARTLPNEGADCHYVLSLCSDALRAADTLAKLTADEKAGADDPRKAQTLGDAQRRLDEKRAMLDQAAATIRAKYSAVPRCFQRCARLLDYK